MLLWGILFLIFLCLVGGHPVYGQGIEEAQQEETLEWMEEIIGGLQLEELDGYLKESMPEKVSFQEVVESLVEEGLGTSTRENVTTYVYEIFFYELANGRDYLIQILSLTILFALLQKLLIS